MVHKRFRSLAQAASALVCAVILSGCVESSDGLGFLSNGNQTSRGVRTVTVLDGKARVRAPDGYCIDQGASREATGFVVMAGCALVSSAAVMPSALGLLTLQIGDAGSALVTGSERDLATYLQGSDGGSLLSGSGATGTVSLKSVVARQGLVEVEFTDLGPPPVAGLGSKEWRAFFDLGTRLVTVAVRGYDHTALSDTQGFSLLRATVQSVIAANSETVALAAN